MVRLSLMRVALLAAYMLALAALLGAGAKQGFPPFPNNYSGKVFIAGSDAPDGIEIFVRIDDYQSHTVPVKDGKYKLLVVQPPNDSFLKKTITFHATRGFGEIQADETAIFRTVNLATSEGIQNTLDLNFPQAPPGAPEPTPTPTPTITPTPLPTPVLPIPGDPSVPQLSRVALFAGIAALATGGAILFVMRRRSAF